MSRRIQTLQPTDFDLQQIVWVGAAAPKKQADRPQGRPCTGGGFAQYLPPFDSDSVRD